VDAQFSPREAQIFFIIRRTGGVGGNGAGLYVSVLDLNEQETSRKTLYTYQLTESTNVADILCARWTGTLLLGTTQAVGVAVKVGFCSNFSFPSFLQDSL
jgi:hypothetical protein